MFGGQTWATGEGQLVNDLWLWTPPAPLAASLALSVGSASSVMT